MLVGLILTTSLVPRAPSFFRIAVSGNTVQERLAPMFSSSEMLRVRLAEKAAPALEAHHGVLEVASDGHGLLRGDVVRAFTTVKPVKRVFGVFPSGKPVRYLFLADGRPAEQVMTALSANAGALLIFVERRWACDVDGPGLSCANDAEDEDAERPPEPRFWL